MGVIHFILRSLTAALLLGVMALGGAAPALAQTAAEIAPAAEPAAAGEAQGDAASETPEPPQPADYVLGPNDRLRVSVFGEPSLSGEFVIDGSGRASLPLVGELSATGLSVRQFERAFEEALEAGEFLNEPRVAAEVLNFRPFYILGEVTRPNQYPYATGLSVLNAVATAGGFTPLADQTRVFIRRAGADSEQIVPLTPEAVVHPGDTIRIPKGAFYILGEVNRPGEYAYSTGLTVLNAVATAAGFTYRANQSRIWIQRAGEPEERAYRIRPDLVIQPGDTIRVGERFF